jgi:hypothetical protein
MPGTEGCPRCGSSLRLSTMVMDVNPPRAGNWTKIRRRILPYDRFLRRARESAARARANSAAAAQPVTDGVLNLFEQAIRALFQWRVIVPGWLHFRDGRTARGRVFLNTFLALLVPAILFFGTTLGSVFLGLAVGVHAAAALDQANYHLPECTRRIRNARWVLMFGLICLGVYWPAWWLVSQVADATVVSGTVGPLRSGDVVLTDHWLPRQTFPGPGSLVLYDLPDRTVGAEREGHRLIVYAGQNIDRILAIGPAQIDWQNGRLTVDGTPSPWQPLTSCADGFHATFVLPRGEVLIFPSGLPTLPPDSDIIAWQNLVCVPREGVEGRVYWRYQPLWRFGLIR